MTAEEPLWLVKSSGRILGPLTATRIGEMLRTREISVLDEVSSPLRRWQTIQYHDRFKELIERLRKSNLSETTDPTWTPNSTGVTSNLTQTLTDSLPSDLTEDLTDEINSFTGTAKEIVIHNVSEVSRSTSSPSAGRYQISQTQNTAVQQQVEKTTRGLWVVTLVVLGVVAAFVMQKRMGGAGDSRMSPATLKQTVISNVAAGQYFEALRLLKTNIPDPAQAGDLAIYYGSLLIQVEGQTTSGRRLLNSVITSRRNDVKQAYTGLGIADLLDGQLGPAQENFDKAIAVDASYAPAVINSAVVSLQRGEYARAKALAIKALQLSPTQGEALLTLAQAEFYLYKGRGDVGELAQSHRLIKEFLAHQWDFTSELGFYGLFFDHLRKDRALDDRLREYLDRDPQLTADHRHNVFIYRGHTQWKVLGRFCEKMVAGLPQGPRASMLLASCLSHEGRWDLARRQIEKAVQQAPKDALVQAWFSYVLQSSGDAAEGSVVLARANEFNRRGEYVLPTLFQARWCQSKEDWDCARESWQKIYQRDMDSLPAVAGLAWVHATRGARGESARMVERGIKISADYIPLLLLKQRAEREGWYATN